MELPSGAIVGLSFAAGVGTALVVTRLHRRRRHRTPATGPDLAREEPPPSPTVRRLRRADLEARESGRSDPDQAADDSGLHLFPLSSSGNLSLGVRDNDELTVPIGGLLVGLSGPGADAAARALLLTLLTHSGDHDVEILIPRADAARLLQLDTDDIAATADHVRALDVTRDLGTALRRLESERIHRARLLDSADHATDLDGIRHADPTEPLPRLVLIGTPQEEHQHQLAAVCSSASVYDIAVVLLGEHPAGPALHLDNGGHVTTTSEADDTEARQWQGLRLFHATTDDAHQVLEVIRTAHGAPEPEPEPEPEQPDQTRATPAPTPPAASPQPPAGERPARLRVLGPPALTVNGHELATGIRGSARELLAYLALHPDGVTRDAVLEALWPQVDHRRAVMRFHAALNDVRRELRHATGLRHENFIIVIADRYRIDPDLLAVDLWSFQAALHQAAQTDDDQMRTDLLHKAAELYEGNLAADHSYEWIEPEREALRRQAVEALIHLADLHERNNEPERALAALDRAQNIDRYAEEIYQHIMILQAKLGRLDAVRRTHRLLEANLEDLSIDPSEETQQLLWRLLHPRRQSRSRHS
ncbi:hypothetical protein E1287_30530 [Actinomadura sp. KC06]|uniref:AfsR/SARP family transcriptional regulator n=1 Tax=Actinomadura sp. KC06 TaxID=2530369 RepID=UPI001042A521|nr:BTAD domain-containing putative transcriptional regulator [Actinomadura sp. KC06]TDD29620.1 hypothetical protein E1287_30530 [Actinomadura sp. KC06]